jgi:hypothetical protein
MTSFAHRLLGAAALDVDTYEEVEADRSATLQAFLVVLLSSICTGIGATGWGGRAWSGVLLFSAAALVGWAVWAIITLEIGGRLLPEAETRVDVGELLRTIGFASIPGALRVIGVLPELTTPIFAITSVWMLIAMIIAVRQALDYHSTMRAVAVCFVGWALATGIVFALGNWFAPPLS